MTPAAADRRAADATPAFKTVRRHSYSPFFCCIGLLSTNTIQSAL